MHRPVIVAVSFVRMVQAAVNEIIHVVTVWNCGMAAVGSVNVLPVVAFRSKRAFVRIDFADRNGVLVHVVTMLMMQVAVVQIIHVAFVQDGDVPAIFAVDVGMLRVSFGGMRFIHKFWPLVLVSICVTFPSIGINHGGGGHGKKCFCKQLA